MEAKDAEGVAHLLQIKLIAAKEGPLSDDEKETKGVSEPKAPRKSSQDASKASVATEGCKGSSKHGFGKAVGEERAEKNGDEEEVLKKANEVDLGKEGKKPGTFPSPKPAVGPADAPKIRDSVGPTKIPSKIPASPPPKSPPKPARRQLATRGSLTGNSRKKKAKGDAAEAKPKARGSASPATLPRHRLLASASPPSASKASTPTSGRRTRRSAPDKEETSDGGDEENSMQKAPAATKKASMEKEKTAESKSSGTRGKSGRSPPAAVAGQRTPESKTVPKSHLVTPSVTDKSAAASGARTKEKEHGKPVSTSPESTPTPSRRSTRSSSAAEVTAAPPPKRRSTRSSAAETLPEPTPMRRPNRSSAAGVITSGVPAPSPIRRPPRSSENKDPPATSTGRSSLDPAAKGPDLPPPAAERNRAAAIVASDEILSSNNRKGTGAASTPESEGTAKRSPTRRSSRKSVPSRKSVEAAANLAAEAELPTAASAAALTLMVEGGSLEPPSSEEEKAKAARSAKRAAGTTFDSMWDYHLAKLLSFKEENGHMMVPKKYPKDQPLSTWVFRQRQERNRYQSRRPTTLTRERIDRLNEVGFVWKPKETEEYKRLEAARKRAISNELWDTRFKELLEYKKSEGHTLVPKAYDVNPALAQWVHRQRTFRKKQLAGGDSKLTKEQVARLEGVGFVWDAKQDPLFKEIEAERKRPEVEKLWEKYFKQLMIFKQTEGHCIVPKKYPANQPLASWVAKQRQNYRLKNEGKNTHFTDEKIRRLEAEGFVFANTRKNKTFHKLEQIRRKPQADALWNKRFRQLLAYKKKKGHTIVPKNYPQNPVLSHWVFRQRASYRMLRTGKHAPLTDAQIRKLDKVGFVWQLRKATKKEDEQEYVEVDKESGSSEEEEDSDDDSTSSSSSSSSGSSSSGDSTSDASSSDESSVYQEASHAKKGDGKVGGSEAREKSSEEKEKEKPIEVASKSTNNAAEGAGSKKAQQETTESSKQGAKTEEINEDEVINSTESGSLRRSGRKRHNSYEDKFGCYIKE